MSASLDQGGQYLYGVFGYCNSFGIPGEEELRMHRFNKEMLSKLKSSHQEKKQLIDQLTQFNDKFSTISSTMDAYTLKLDSILIELVH